ncbi:MAG: hypothetical protein KAV82_11800, partial [Phycisphaerae bacterium]|nr:hypothetical protein [Phycisphaerae bacterium]
MRLREIDNLPERLRLMADADLDNGAAAKAVWETHNLQERINLRTFTAYATARRRGHRVARIAEQAEFFRQILDTLEVPRDGLTRIQEVQLGAALRGILNGGKPTAVLRAVEVANDIRRTQIKGEAQQIAAERFAAWKPGDSGRASTSAEHRDDAGDRLRGGTAYKQEPADRGGAVRQQRGEPGSLAGLPRPPAT